jgi:protein-disulfide isomerase/formylglycine-generating enzyme required for sulfatase activity
MKEALLANGTPEEASALALHALLPPMYASSDGWPATAPVGSFPRGATVQGLEDMAGNVSEWTQGLGVFHPSSRVSRGGGFGPIMAPVLRASSFTEYAPTDRKADLGFRCARLQQLPPIEPARVEAMVHLAGATLSLPDQRDPVTVAPLWMDAGEVTVDAYAACVRAGLCTADHLGDASDDDTLAPNDDCNSGKASQEKRPINCVDWEQASAYCAAVGKRLPLDDEWIRAGHGEVSERDTPNGIHGLGEDAEWTASQFDEHTLKVRGGLDPATSLQGMPHTHRGTDLGFRCALDGSEPPGRLATAIAAVTPAVAPSTGGPATPGAWNDDGSPVPVSSRDPVWGRRDAPVTIVEFSDFQCPFCLRVTSTLAQVRQVYGPDKVRLVWKNQPLPFHNRARPTADAAVTVFGLGGSDAFWKFHDLAFANAQSLTDENLEAWALQSGIDANQFKQALASKKFTSKVDEDTALASKVGALGTPAFRINGVTVSGAQPFDNFKAVIDQQLDEADKALKGGTKPGELYVALSKKFYTVQAPTPKAVPEVQEDATTVWNVPVDPKDPVRGPGDAVVTIVEWADFQCPFCQRAEATLKQIVDTYSRDVRVVWKDNPLPFHNRAKAAATLARVAKALQGDAGFWAAHDALFENQSNLDDPGLEKLAGQLHLPWTRIKGAIASDRYKADFEASVDVAMDLNARGTPHFFINGRRLSGAQPFENFKKLIDEELVKARALVDGGTPRARLYDDVMKDAKGPPPPERKDVPLPGKGNPVKGPAGAKVVIQEFADFQCPFCKRAQPTMDQIIKQYGGRVKVVWRNLPLDFHTDAPLAAEAAYEAFVQQGNGGFWRFQKKLYDKQPDIKRPTLEAIAQEIGLDMRTFRAALDDHTHRAAIDDDKHIADTAGIRGTPGFTINGYFLSGAQPFAQFDKLIKLALKEAK